MNKQHLVTLWFIAFWVIFSGNVNADTPALTLHKNGEIIKTLSVTELMQLKSGVTAFAVDNPTDSKIHTYQGMLLTVLLEQVFGSNWTQFNAVKFIAQDGYQAIIPSATITAHMGMVATGENGHIGFSVLRRKNGEMVDPAPFFLMWENIHDASAKKEAWLSWSWQLASIELTSLAREYPHSVPPDTANDKVKQGFVDFQQHCMKCHAINGDGGTVGPELNSPVNVTEYWQSVELAHFIADPQSVRPNSKMIAFDRDVTNRSELIESIIMYLKSMVDKKIPIANQVDK